jgi:glycosyltransferase involved in cell wall biosynthesis
MTGRADRAFPVVYGAAQRGASGARAPAALHVSKVAERASAGGVNHPARAGREGFDRMRIAQIAPLMEAVPPKTYGGSERVVSWLTDALVELGHDVTLFATGDSVSKARLEPVCARALRFETGMRDTWAPHIYMIETVASRAPEFDIIHSHIDYLAFPALKRCGTPFVTTLHGRMDLPELKPVYGCFPDAPVVSISDAQRAPLPEAHYAATIYHGLPETLLNPGPGEGGYLAFIGRISPEKAPDAAIRIAAKAGMRLKIAAKIDKVDKDYFEERIAPLMNQPHVEFIGEIDDSQKSAFLGMIEAMACGTPVVAMRNGSVPEVIEEGATGFIVDNEDDAATAARRLPMLDRGRVRQRFEARFTARRMAADYVNLYHRLSEGYGGVATEGRG